MTDCCRRRLALKIGHYEVRVGNRPLQTGAIIEPSMLPSAIDECRELVNSPQMMATRKQISGDELRSFRRRQQIAASGVYQFPESSFDWPRVGTRKPPHNRRRSTRHRISGLLAHFHCCFSGHKERGDLSVMTIQFLNATNNSETRQVPLLEAEVAIVFRACRLLAVENEAHEIDPVTFLQNRIQVQDFNCNRTYPLPGTLTSMNKQLLSPRSLPLRFSAS